MTDDFNIPYGDDTRRLLAHVRFVTQLASLAATETNLPAEIAEGKEDVIAASAAVDG